MNVLASIDAPMTTTHHMCPQHCCQFIPPHILEDLSILNDVSMDVERSSQNSSAFMHSSARMGAAPARIINIRPTLHSITKQHVAGELREDYAWHTIRSGAALSSTSRNISPAFPVYDLDGATDAEASNGLNEYQNEMINNPSSKLLETVVERWPHNAQRAYDGARQVYRFFLDEFQRNSIDGLGMNIVSCVGLKSPVITYDINGEPMYALDKYRKRITVGVNNAFWDRKEMVYGGGDGGIFTDLTSSDDVIGHEITHGITQYTCKLKYKGESGALNEHISDVFGITFKHKNQRMYDPLTANWLIGDGCISDDFRKMLEVKEFGYFKALRSMQEPGEAYEVKKGRSKQKDKQPAHMRDFFVTSADNGGVHHNSGIPNKAFCLFAKSSGGPSWRIPGQIWYRTIVAATFGTIDERGEREATIEEFADATLETVKEIFPDQREKLVQAWLQVGVPVS